jgi:hypothetical protein
LDAMAIWQNLIDDPGFDGRYASVRRFVRALRGRPPLDARAVVTTAPAKKARWTTWKRRFAHDAATAIAHMLTAERNRLEHAGGAHPPRDHPPYPLARAPPRGR